MELPERVALITGAASGLGLATARAFAREGATVIVNDLSLSLSQEAASSLGKGHSAVVGDVSDEKHVKLMVAEALERHGKIDILVNNAGVPDSFTPTVEQPLSHWQRLIDIHLTGTYLVSKTVAPSMIARRCGSHSEFELDRRRPRAPGSHRLQRGQGRDRDADARAWLRVGAAWRPGQRGRAGLHSDSFDGKAHRRRQDRRAAHPQTHPDGHDGESGGCRGRSGFSRL